MTLSLSLCRTISRSLCLRGVQKNGGRKPKHKFNPIKLSPWEKSCMAWACVSEPIKKSGKSLFVKGRSPYGKRELVLSKGYG